MAETGAALVARGIALDRQIAKDTEELKEIKAELLERALKDHGARTSTELGGWSWTCADKVGNIARVTAPAAALKPVIPSGGDFYESVRTLAGKSFALLFEPAPAYALADDFRLVAKEKLGAKLAKKLIDLVTVKAKPKVAFETKKAAA